MKNGLSEQKCLSESFVEKALFSRWITCISSVFLQRMRDGGERNCWQICTHKMLTALNQERLLIFKLAFCSSDYYFHSNFNSVHIFKVTKQIKHQ